jgi:lysophospholipase
MKRRSLAGGTARLVGYAANTVPEGTECGYLTTSDGVNLRYALLRSGQDLKGTVCLLQGRGDFIERYFETMSDLRQRGYAVATFDWRGQGGSDRLTRNSRKGHIASFRQYDEDLQSFISHVLMPDCPPPYFALGQSMSGCVLVRVLRQRNWFNKVILTAPMFDVQTGLWPPRVARFLVRFLGRLGLGRVFIPGERRKPLTAKDFPGNDLTADGKRFARDVRTIEIAPELGIGAPTIGWARAAFEAMREVMMPAKEQRVRVPVLVVAADTERVTSTEACYRLAGLEPAVVTVVVEHSRHEILMERDEVREQFWAAFDAFIEGQDPTLAANASA